MVAQGLNFMAQATVRVSNSVVIDNGTGLYRNGPGGTLLSRGKNTVGATRQTRWGPSRLTPLNEAKSLRFHLQPALNALDGSKVTVPDSPLRETSRHNTTNLFGTSDPIR